MKKYNLLRTALLVGFSCGLLLSQLGQAKESIKFSILTPDGSTWTNLVKEMGAELEASTEKELTLKVFAGGKKGDESQNIQLMRSGNLHAAGLTGIGLGQIYTPIRIMELPFLWDSQEELVYVLGKMKEFFKKGFNEKGFQLLGWAPPGFVNIFSKTPVRNQADMKSVKMWAWAGDPLVAAMFKSYDITPVEVGLPDVLTSLQTGLLTAAYAPPLAALALQWSSKVDYITRDNLALSVGALIITNKRWEQLTPEHQTLLTQLANKYTQKIQDATVIDNQKALEKFAQEGKKFVDVEPAEKQNMIKVSKKVRAELTGKLFTKAELLSVLEYRLEYQENVLNGLEKTKKELEAKVAKAKAEEKTTLTAEIAALKPRMAHFSALIKNGREDVDELSEPKEKGKSAAGAEGSTPVAAAPKAKKAKK